jgi:hypothetical protein
MPKRSPALDDTPVDAGRVSRCAIILVHGTWGRGVFPKRREVFSYPRNKRWWFEEGSQFRTGLDEALKSASLDWPIHPFLWSGANSVHARDCAARELSDQLTKDLQGDPDAMAVIVAHSHGGNVALRALQHLNSMAAGKIKVITLATPFLRVFARRSLQLPFVPKVLVFGAMPLILLVSFWLCMWIIFATIGLSDMQVTRAIQDHRLVLVIVSVLLVIVPVLLVVAGIFIARWLIAVFTNPQAAHAIEEKASYDTRGAAASRMLVIRGVDDEASLSLAVGSIGSRLSYLVLVGVIPAIYLMSMVAMVLLTLVFLPFHPQGEWTVWLSILFFGAMICAPVFLILPGVFESLFFGREFLVNALVCDIAVDSVPDTLGQVEAITLKPVEAGSSEPGWISYGSGLEMKWLYRSSERRFSPRWWSEMIRIWWRGWRTGEFLKSVRLSKSSWQLRHGIYNHPHCVDEIVRWLRRVA